MAGNQNYQLQIEKLKELMAYLRHFNDEVQNAMNNYRTKVAALVEQGLPTEVGERFMSEFYQESKHIADKNSVAVNEKAIPYVAHNIKSLEQLLGR